MNNDNTDNNSNRKRPFGATFRTLNDITNNTSDDIGGGGDGGVATAASNTKKIVVQHIKTLPDEKSAASILRRIHSEFHTIIERRGWNLTSITEMCCCGDGIDCFKKRKTKVMPNNVLGYNRTSTSHIGKDHDIHLRLRHPVSHTLLDYESIAATMCHELAHCVRGPHDAHFYKAMEEIEEQYAVYIAKGVVVDKDGFPIGSKEVYVLGNGGSKRRNNAPFDRDNAFTAAESRRKSGLTSSSSSSGYVLGGKSSTIQNDPRDAARIAAERRLLDAQYCLPCNEVIEILGDSSDEEGGNDDDHDDEVEILGTTSSIKAGRPEKKKEDSLDMKPAAKTAKSDDGVIDLTLDDSFEMASTTLKQPPTKSRKCNPLETSQANMNWICKRCTLVNIHHILACEACGSERPCGKTIFEQAKELKKEDDIANIKESEVEQSKLQFEGFNIYGNTKQSSSLMKHLT